MVCIKIFIEIKINLILVNILEIKIQTEIGKIKGETKGVPLVQFVELRSEMYSLRKETGEEDKKAIVVKKC